MLSYQFPMTFSTSFPFPITFSQRFRFLIKRFPLFFKIYQKSAFDAQNFRKGSHRREDRNLVFFLNVKIK